MWLSQPNLAAGLNGRIGMQITSTASIVTGGGLGLGAATVRSLAAGGSRVFALDLAESIANAPAIDGVTYVEADVCNPDQIQGAIAQAVASGHPL
jgi:NAD(P)-dependent dehydrogenase (short-subunit alcohol dehydrogenase family)